jgi:hypothetical protein
MVVFYLKALPKIYMERLRKTAINLCQYNLPLALPGYEAGVPTTALRQSVRTAPNDRQRSTGNCVYISFD